MALIVPVSIDSGVITYDELAGRLRKIRTGSDAVFQAAESGGDHYTGGFEVLLLVKNVGVDAHEVTRLKQVDPGDPAVVPDDVTVCDPGEVAVIPPISSKYFHDAAGFVQVRYPVGAAPDLSVYALRIFLAR